MQQTRNIFGAQTENPGARYAKTRAGAKPGLTQSSL